MSKKADKVDKKIKRLVKIQNRMKKENNLSMSEVYELENLEHQLDEEFKEELKHGLYDEF